MTLVDKVERAIVKCLKPIPHLPASIRKFIAENIWWIILIPVIFVVIGTLLMTGCAYSAMSLLMTTLRMGSGCAIESCANWSILGSILSLVVMIAIAMLLIIASSPLRSLKKDGWKLLFWALILKAFLVIIDIFSNYNAFRFAYTIVIGIIGVVICTYLLFEVRSYFKISSESKATSGKK